MFWWEKHRRLTQSADYQTVKGAILRACELVSEAYRERFRDLNKLDKQTYVDFAKEKEALFSRWCKSQKAETKEDLTQLILLEKFKNCLPDVICTYINEQKVSTLDKAAVLADEFILTHKTDFDKRQGEKKGRALFHRPNFSKPVSTSASFASKPAVGGAPFQRRLVSIVRNLAISLLIVLSCVEYKSPVSL